MSRVRPMHLLLGSVLVAGLTAATAPGAMAEMDALYCKRVIADDIRVFTTAGGDGFYGYYYRGTQFTVDRTDAPKNRYHLPNFPSASGEAWTTSDPAYVRSC